MRRAYHILKFPTKTATTSLCLITAAGAATLASQTLNPTSLPFTDDFRPNSAAAFSEVIGAGLSGIIGSTVIDYKISLHGLSEDSDDYRRVLSEVHLRSAKIILQLCDANKGFYTKAGQFVAALPQVPKEYSSTLSSLQDQAVPCQFKDIKKVLTSNLGPDLSKIFLSFDELPIAAASIAQVHHAVLKDHQEVAVKVQYPGLEHQLKVDIAAMSLLSKFVAWVSTKFLI
ncbi:hypothetical protein U1Q18_039828 [Sarracenia purpurea var. burkii]